MQFNKHTPPHTEHRSKTHSNESQHLAEGTEVAHLRRRFSFALQQEVSFRSRHHLCRQGVALASTRQLRSQGPVSVQAHRTEGVTGSGGRKGANGVGGRIGVEGGNGDVNVVGGGNGDVNGHVDGAGTETGRGRGRGWRPVDEHRMGTGTEARTVAEMGTGTRITGTRIGSERAEERRRSARNRKILVDAMWEAGKTWVERGKNVEKKGLVQ